MNSASPATTNSGTDILTELQQRGLINQTTPGLAEHLSQPRTLYCGFDPTADSLHIGSLVPLLTLKRFQQAGHRPIVLVGGATGMIGDPSFKAQERKLNTAETVQQWAEKLKAQTSRFVEFTPQKGQQPALLANNYSWTHTVDILTFLRNVGKHFSVNNLINKEAIKSRLEREDSGISFTEFTYPLLQAFDFQQLIQQHNCTLQIGGSDQWGNMVAGTELIRKTLQKEAHVLTLPLVTKADGTKFGKTESGTIWLSAEKTSPYAFYQFWLNTADADVEKFLKYFTFKSLSTIGLLMDDHKKNPGARNPQRALAEEITELVHGTEALKAAIRISGALFSGQISNLRESDFAQLFQDGLLSLIIDSDARIISQEFKKDGLIHDFLIEVAGEEGLLDIKLVNKSLEISEAMILMRIASSKREAREFIANGAIERNGEKVTDPTYELTKTNAAFGKYHLLRRGKKNYALLILE